MTYMFLTHYDTHLNHTDSFIVAHFTLTMRLLRSRQENF